MLRLLRITAAALGAAGFVFVGLQPAEAGCQLVKATHSSSSKGVAAKMSQALVMQSARDLQRSKGWRSISLRARLVKGEGF